MIRRADLLGHTEPTHYLWCASQHHQLDPSKPAAIGTRLPRGDFRTDGLRPNIFSSFALGQDRRVQETHRHKAESHAIMSAATELFRASAQLPEEKTRGPRRDDLATVKLRAITEVRRDST